MNLIQRLLILTVVLTIPVLILAEDYIYPPTNNYSKAFSGPSLGLNVDVKIANDFKLGASVSSPFFFDGLFCFRGEAALGIFRGATNTAASDLFMNYLIFKGGIVLTGSYQKDFIRPYGEFGGMWILPNQMMTKYSSQWGLYTLLGFDLLFNDSVPYIFYLGVGCNAILSDSHGVSEKTYDTSTNSYPHPFFSTGLIISTGFRFYLK